MSAYPSKADVRQTFAPCPRSAKAVLPDGYRRARLPGADGSLFAESALARSGSSLGLFHPLPPRFLSASRLSQQKVFKDEVAFATGKGLTAGHFLEDAFRSRFDFDNLI
jgi:hypothetical protein